ncbi:MAG TPA: sulfatase, partial [Gemmatimonadaceae bacterium]
RAASLSLYGGRALTPALDSIAASGIVFERAVSVAPWTLPSHATLFTGLWPHEHGADWRVPLGSGPPTLAEVLAAGGYRTGGFVANLVFASREHGLQRGFQVYQDYRRSPGALIRSASLAQTLTTSTLVRRMTGFRDVTGRKRARDVNREFLDWESETDGAPWFAFLNYFDAHEPYQPRPPYAGMYSSGLSQRRFDVQRFWHVEGGIVNWGALAASEVEAERAAYEEAITGLDADLGRLFAELRRRGVLDRTVVIVTSDHGELFGEHATYTHGNSIFWRTIHVPLVVAWPPGIPGGRRLAGAVSLRDLPATILDLALGPAAPRLPGEPWPLAVAGAERVGSLPWSALSLDPFNAGDAAMQHGSLQSLAGASWQYSRAAGGQEEAFLTGSAGRPDTLVTVPAVRAAIIDTARARLGAAGIPAPRDSTR